MCNRGSTSEKALPLQCSKIKGSRIIGRRDQDEVEVLHFDDASAAASCLLCPDVVARQLHRSRTRTDTRRPGPRRPRPTVTTPTVHQRIGFFSCKKKKNSKSNASARPLSKLLRSAFFTAVSDPVAACDFHHDGSLLTKFNPEEDEKFFRDVARAEQDCEVEIEKQREQQCAASTGADPTPASLEAHQTVKCPSSSVHDPNFQAQNQTLSQMAWSRFGFRSGKMPPPFEAAGKIRGATGAFVSQEQGEGAGARVRRSIGRPELRNLDPFLMLDEFKVGLPAGFPDHPHRGMETVTYMFPDTPGNMTHEDSKGNAGTLGPSDLQWMTAARGIMHSEVPETTKEAHGLQMWINLAREHKMSPPEYQEISAAELTRAQAADENGKTIQVAIAAGESLGETSQVRTRTPCYLVHVKMLEKGSVFRQLIPENFTAFLYTLNGAEIVVTGDGTAPDKQVAGHTTVTLQNGGAAGGKTGIEIRAVKPESQFVLVAAKPIGEPIVQYGPFVMTSQAEIQDAFRDYQSGRNGFEGAANWESKNKRRMR